MRKEDQQKISVFFEMIKVLKEEGNLTEEWIKTLLERAYRLGHKTGHMQAEQYSAGLIESYKDELRRLDERICEYEQ